MDNDFVLEAQIASDLNNHKFVAPSIKGYGSTAINNIEKTETKAEMLWSEKKITKITRDKLISDMESLRYCITQMKEAYDVLANMLETAQQENKND